MFPRGRSACCNEVPIGGAETFKVMSEGGWRERPPHWRQVELVESQGWACLYCDEPFHSLRRVCWDHFVPLSLAHNNATQNFVAACRLCNSLKGSLVFETVEEVRTYVRRKIEKREHRRLRKMPRVVQEDPAVVPFLLDTLPDALSRKTQRLRTAKPPELNNDPTMTACAVCKRKIRRKGVTRILLCSSKCWGRWDGAV